ncbi:MAG TPA: 3'(2'),5'-bisphosphate nucleotidase CysQ [Steroidobacteraceae bacterium]|nr:3'(2'),5'-bisphosphate nucleotidase CysQ [Steroidobacteraceae bacterium]
MSTDAKLLTDVVALARRAGNAILEVYGQQFEVTNKADHSPLTLADTQSHDVIVQGLRALTPDLPVLSEEASDIPFSERRQWQRYWLVDPLDGTKEFVSRNGEFTVNIALIDGHDAVLGVVHVPVSDTTYTGVRGVGASRQVGSESAVVIKTSASAATPLRIVGSRSHRDAILDRYLPRLEPYQLVAVGSSLKFCLVAEGSADLYPRFGPTSEWDTAAAQAVVEAAGGRVVQTDGQPLRYNAKSELLNPHFLVSGDARRDWLGELSIRDQRQPM